MATRIIPLKAGQRCRCVFDISPAGSHEKAGAVCMGGTHVPMQAVGDELITPPMPPGLHLFEVRVDGVSVAYGYFEVAPSPLADAGGEVTASFTGDLTAPVARFSIELNQGPRGDSTYDIAVRAGYEGTEAEWLESLRVQAATLAVEQAAPLVERAENARAAAEQEAARAEEAQTKAEQEASKAERHAELLGDAAMQSGDNSFAGNNDHAGTEIFNGAVALNGAVSFPGGSTTAAEMAAGFFYARRYWEMAADISGLFKEQSIDSLPKNEDGLVVLNFPAAKSGKEVFVKCRCSAAYISLPSVSTQENLTDILCGLNNNNGNNPYSYGTYKLYLPSMERISLDYPLRLWAAKIVIDAPAARVFECDARKQGLYGSLPAVEDAKYKNSYYALRPVNGHKWFIKLPALKVGTFGGTASEGSSKVQLIADSVFCILGTVPVWADGEAHALHLNILPSLQGDADFQERLAAALGSQNDDGSYKGALVRVYEENGSSGEDELGKYTDEYVADKGWQITISYI